MIVWGALLLVLVLLPTFHIDAAHGASAQGRQADLAPGGAAAASVAAPMLQAAGVRFLTLPFSDPRIIVSQGWIYDWGSQHSGTDYMLGDRNSTNWQPFNVYAAADGYACGNCTTRQGNAVWIKHIVGGQTIYTYYGHLDTIDPAIPVGSQQNTVLVQRGQKIGVSGKTGADVIHLHFGVYSASSQPMDPYDLWTTRELYFPGCSNCQMGPNNMWTTNPPTLASGDTPPPPVPPPPAATATPVPPTNTPVPTPTKVSCTVTYGQTVSGNLSANAPEARYCLSVAAGDWVAVRMFAVQGASLDTYLKLVAPDGSVLATDDDGAQVDSNSFLVKQVITAGTYSIVASGYAGTGAFKLRIDKGSKSALGDMNGDCVVNKIDIQLMANAVANQDPVGDLNLDGSVDGQDQTILLYRLGRGCMAIK